GRSKVEWITSPLTVRCMSVTSSGRSSTSTTMRGHSGLFLVIAFAIACRIIVLPAFGGDTMRPRWPLPIGLTRAMVRGGRAAGADGGGGGGGGGAPGARRVRGVQRPQLGDPGRGGGGLGVGAVPLAQPARGVNFSPPLSLAGLAHRALDDVALAQAVPAHLG